MVSVVAKCRLKKRQLLSGFLAADRLVSTTSNSTDSIRRFAPSLSHLNLICSWQPNFLATTLHDFPWPFCLKNKNVHCLKVHYLFFIPKGMLSFLTILYHKVNMTLIDVPWPKCTFHDFPSFQELYEPWLPQVSSIFLSTIKAWHTCDYWQINML